MGEILRQHSIQTAAWLSLDLFNQTPSEEMEQKVEFEIMKKRVSRAGEEEGALR